MTKKILSIFVISIAVASMSACGSKSQENTKGNTKRPQVTEESGELKINDRLQGMWNDESGNYYYFYEDGNIVEYNVSGQHAALGNYALEEKDGEYVLNIACDAPVGTYEVENKDAQIVLKQTDGNTINLSVCKNGNDVEKFKDYLNTQFKDEENNVYNFSDDVNYDGYLADLKQHVNGEYMIVSDGRQVILSIRDGGMGKELLYYLEMTDQGIKLTGINDRSEHLLEYL